MNTSEILFKLLIDEGTGKILQPLQRRIQGAKSYKKFKEF